MPKTRSQASDKRERDRLRKAKYRAHLAGEKQKEKAAAMAKNRATVSKIDREKALDQELRMKKLSAEVIGVRERNKELRSERDGLLAKYVLGPDEPSTDDATAKAAEAALERALKGPGVMQRLTNETPEEFEELWALVQESLAKINYRGEVRQRSAI